MSLSEEVVKFIEKENLFGHSDHLLVAVSGGVDSMVLLQILHNQGFKVSVAHVNYKLRDIDSDRDYELVKAYCDNNKLTFHFYPLSDEEKHNLKRGNLQEKARKIRHQWFRTLMEQHSYQYLCTAHHKNDQIETFFLNSIRGSGLVGLTSMSAIKNEIRRPLLPWFKSQITTYAHDNKIHFRTDQTNLESTYDRNYLRNEILEKVYARFEKSKAGLAKTNEILNDEKLLLEYLVSKSQSKWVTVQDDIVKIGPITELRKVSGTRTLLFRYLTPYGYNVSTVDDILSSHEHNGALFLSDSHEAVVHDSFLFIRSKEVQKITDQSIKGTGIWETETHMLNIRKVNHKEWSTEPNKELIDLDKVEFPLTLRSYQEGDRFYPIGMRGRSKLLSDYFVDKKLMTFDKEKVKLLCTKDQIIWVVGYRLDDRYKVTDNTTNIGEISWKMI